MPKFFVAENQINNNKITIIGNDVNHIKNVLRQKSGDKIWKCRNCGHIVIGKQAPEICPVCSHPKAYFEIKAENY